MTRAPLILRLRPDAPLVCLAEYPASRDPRLCLLPLRQLALTPDALALGREVLAHLKASGGDPLTSPVWAAFADAISVGRPRQDALTLVRAGAHGHPVHILPGPPPTTKETP